jgi:ubiquinone/menaquinone biosynthesis C-methylase UbiE
MVSQSLMFSYISHSSYQVTMSVSVTPYLDRVFTAQTTDESRRLYDEWATTYDSDMQKHDFTAPRLVAKGVSRTLKLNHLHRDHSEVLKGLRIADAGCGTGTVGIELAKMGAEDIVGLDISEGMLEVARKSGAYKDLQVADLTKKLPYEDGEFDALTCCGTFTHGHLGPEPLAEFVRVVKSGGVVVATILESHWNEKGFQAEADRLANDSACDIVDDKVHQYRKDAGGGRILILRSI